MGRGSIFRSGDAGSTAITRARLDLVRKRHSGKAGFHYTDLPQGTRVEVEMPFQSAF